MCIPCAKSCSHSVDIDLDRVMGSNSGGYVLMHVLYRLSNAKLYVYVT
jgi:hypothetical protein